MKTAPAFTPTVCEPLPGVQLIETFPFSKTVQRSYQMGLRVVTVSVERPGAVHVDYAVTAEDPKREIVFQSTFSYKKHEADAIAECLDLWKENVLPFIR